MNDYKEFLQTKRIKSDNVGFKVNRKYINPILYDFQKDIVNWAIERGRACIFADCGMGKTFMQLEWARAVQEHTGGNILLLTPLAVSAQTQREAKKLDIPVIIKRTGIDNARGIIITNYERLHYFNQKDYVGIILDESSILKGYNGKTRQAIQDFASTIQYRLACTATPAPNDLIELTNHAEFLDIMTGKEIIGLFFKQDGNTTHAWRLKGHAKDAFWKWMSTWSVAIRFPSDLGYEDGAFILPELMVQQITIEGHTLPDMLFPIEAQSLLERRQARRLSLDDRCKIAADIANEDSEQCLIWCDLNRESELLTRSINGAVEVRGSDTIEHKENSLIGFTDGKIRALVTKPSIAGHGMNWQHCNKMIFVGLSDSYEYYYQAVRRCWRFGQKRPVKVYVITADTEGAVVKNIEYKEHQAENMFQNIVKYMSIYQDLKHAKRERMIYMEKEMKGNNWTMLLGDCVEVTKKIEDEKIGFTIFSPPFPGMYTYTNSERDMGNSLNIDSMIEHFKYLFPELLRVTIPGRCVAIHLMQLTAMKGREGYIGLKDYRGKVIESMESTGWRFAGEVTIDKNPQVQATRNKERGLLFKTLAKDSSLMRMALADYLILFRKDGDNPTPIQAGISKRYKNEKGWITESEWIEWAAPVWYRRVSKDMDGRRVMTNYPALDQSTDGIMETDVLNVRGAREDKDERHLCPLQLGVIERAVKLWSAPGDTVFSPFAGIGSEGYIAIKYNRKFIGIELKETYFNVACDNLKRISEEVDTNELFTLDKEESHDET